MATKTISLELDAYEKLRAAKRGRESFSSVVRRAVILDGEKSGAELLALIRNRGALFSEGELDKMEKATLNDLPPISPWDEES
jgi:predicted CopG family antitoxin